MVHEYKTLSHTFEEIKAENASLKNSSAESSSDELEDTDSLKTELSRLKIENDLLRNEASELKAEVDKLIKEMSSWNQSTRSLLKLYESQKPLNDKTGVGFNYDSSHGETSTQSQPVYDKFNERSFVKGGVIHDCIESIRYDDQDTSQLDRKGKGKVGVGYQRPENSKLVWLKNKLNKDKAKAGPKFFVPNQPRHYSKKAKTEWTRNQSRRNLHGQNIKSKFKRPARNFAQTFVDPRTGKTVRIIQVWVPKGLIQSGPKRNLVECDEEKIEKSAEALFQQLEYSLEFSRWYEISAGSYSRTSRWMIQTQEMKRRRAKDSADGLCVCYNQQTASVEFTSSRDVCCSIVLLGVHTGAACVGGCFQIACNHQSLLVESFRGGRRGDEEYDVWKIRMQAHLAAQNDDMWEVITNGPLKIMKANPAFAITGGAPEWIEKSRAEYTTEDKKKANLDNVAKDILYKTLDKDMFSYIKTCATAKEIWEKLTQICEGNDRKVFVAEESNRNWADSDSDSTSSSSSSSDSEQEKVNCLMANDFMEDEVFDFSNIEFTREDLISALHEMVDEYRKLSQTFEEVKAENKIRAFSYN
ncbi:hypothetical protein F511_40661 [Dorcoceras hygrometricum]|uniref:Uncharacterized protein n=1 Tax=Dorcoceras hygrometricum TaxID=472368 RepID=A0A2Z7C6P3_9LAMI|nr:hypothetical protein F511_40661 [Dorcoceras hygrometricum]